MLSRPATATRLPSSKKQAKFAAAQAQQKAMKAAQEYFADSDSDNVEEDLMKEDESEDYRFFLRVLTEVGELRSLYNKCWVGSDFWPRLTNVIGLVHRNASPIRPISTIIKQGQSCLVCGGIEKKVGKRSKNCVALVQHANGIAKTRKRRAHRALAQVVCKALGWDIDSLLAIAASLGKSVEQGNNEVEVGMEDSNVQNQNLGMESIDDSEVMVNESSLKVGATNECMENLDNGILSVADGKTAAVDSLEPCEDNGFGNEIKNDQNGIVVINDLKDDKESQK
ncbi:hypothetical protein Acr_17g0010040 [Actinidia rufa]|uniref:Uncharacterized protein n=1 Tax=Actinidia rufa TaxID=165716 RepID=A0A7J0G3U4_9ERIC|nr:hypothetical protein Acr_17g0010040 [Actinidia rufa]